MLNLEDRVGMGDSIESFELSRVKLVFSIGDPKSNRSSNFDMIMDEVVPANLELLGNMSRADLKEVWTQAYKNDASEFDVSTLSYIDKQALYCKFEAEEDQNTVKKELIIPYYDTARNPNTDAETILPFVRFSSTNDDANVVNRRVTKATLIRQI